MKISRNSCIDKVTKKKRKKWNGGRKSKTVKEIKNSTIQHYRHNQTFSILFFFYQCSDVKGREETQIELPKEG